MSETKDIIEKIKGYEKRETELKLDNAELRQLIRALTLVEEKSAVLNSIIESSDDAIISKDLNSIITSWNASATRIFGYLPDEMIGESILKLIPLERHDEEPKILSQLRQGLRVDHFETQRLRKDGTLIHVSLTISPIKDNYGNVVGLSKIARDITDKKLMQQKKDEFVSFVSHELKTPLTSLKSYIQVAAKKTSDEIFLLKALGRAEVQAKKMENMIRDFLNLSRFEEGKISIENAVFDVVNTLDDCIADALVISHKHAIKYQGLASCKVNADQEKIAMVITNLISNAQKYSPEGGDITVSCERHHQMVNIKVADKGLGISTENQKLLFQKFHRVETEKTELIPGFGIGLYLVSTVLTLHGSQIVLKSELGSGSEFSFELPAG
ncbi:PAS domain S-box protein [Pedobacter frigidisoli]|uniref:sensor histidine kinase n=1 Tax=Pedobacter frigidisoli TaxID=2530455 RepID=UPI0029314BFE|nr:PAS domain S-box protein [Pedobacter frigidisoli]